jgi:hypothetical protein
VAHDPRATEERSQGPMETRLCQCGVAKRLVFKSAADTVLAWTMASMAGQQ